MAVKNKMFFILSVLFALFNTACEEGDANNEDCNTYDYRDCNTVEPFEAELSMTFSISKNIKIVPFEIYKGGVDQNVVIARDTARNSTVTYIMAIPEYYSVRAKYEVDGKTIYTIDGVKMDKRSVQKCDSVCWKDANKKLDLSLH